MKLKINMLACKKKKKKKKNQIWEILLGFLFAFSGSLLLPNLQVQEFLNLLVHFLCPRAASCKERVTDCQVCDVLKLVGLNKSSGLDGNVFNLLVCSASHGSEDFAEERWEPCFGRLR